MTRGAVVWVTGLPAAGKSTFARALARRLRRDGREVVLLDGDEVRGALVPAPGYTPRARAAFYETLGRLAVLLAGQGPIVVVAATANRRAFRDAVRRRVRRFVEVFVDVPPEVCVARDPKGLYRRGVRGLPGRGAAYEPPLDPEVVARGGRDRVALERAASTARGERRGRRTRDQEVSASASAARGGRC